jgi:hypothetical protein
MASFGFRRFFQSWALAGLALAFFGLAKPAVAANGPTILFVNYTCPDPSIHIGSTMTIFMGSVIATTSLNLTVSAASSTQISLSGPQLATVPSQLLYVTDGLRAWEVNYTSGFPVTIQNGNLFNNNAPFTVADYSTLVNSSFRVYTGSKVIGASGASAYVDIASFDSVPVNDSGLNGDTNNGDGVFTGQYFVTDLNFVIESGRLYGWTSLAGDSGTSPFTSAMPISIDALRPKIDAYLPTTDKQLYNGMLYVSSLSVGSSTATDTNGHYRLDITVNKRNTIVDVVVGSAVPAVLPPLIVPSGATNLNGWRTWDGRDGNNVFQGDGVYPVTMYIRDINGVVGITKTSQVRITTLRMEIKNITLTPASLKTQPPIANGNLTTLAYNTVISNESGTGVGLALRTLGWTGNLDYSGGGNGAGFQSSGSQLSCVTCTVWAVPNLKMLNPDGTTSLTWVGTDGNLTTDQDADWVRIFRSESTFFPLPDCYAGLPQGAPNTTSITGSVVNVGDGDPSNDLWEMEQFYPYGIAPSDPTSLSSTAGTVFIGSNNVAGSRRLVVYNTLTGLDFYRIGQIPTTDDTPGCGPVAAFRGQKLHMDRNTDGRGMGLSAIDTSVMFAISDESQPTSDNSAPFLLSTSPQDQATIAPNTYGGSGIVLSAQVRDNESPVRSENTITYIKLTDPRGNDIGGDRATSGGGPSNLMVATFRPYAPLTLGGLYKLTVFACNTVGLCFSKDISFTVLDQTAPDVASVELVSSTQLTNIPLSINQSNPEGPFDNISEVWVGLSIDSQSANTIDWPSSNVSLYQVTGTTRVAISMTRLTTGIPSDGKLHYRLLSPITGAGMFEVVTQTFSKDGASGVFTGPSNVNYPRFTTIINSNSISVPFSNNPGNGRLAVTGLQPVTVTSGGTPASLNLLQAFLPNFIVLPADPGFLRLLTTAESAQGMQFNIGGGALLTPLVWQYQAANPVRFHLYYNDSDLPAGVAETDLRIRGYDGSAWQTVVAQQDATVNTGNSFTIVAPNGSASMAIYAIAYASTLSNASSQPTATPLAFKNTRSFSPTHANPIYRKARFYYSDIQPKEMDVKIYDTAGTLIKSMSLGNGVQMGDTLTDPSTLRLSYFFEWDGLNDSGQAAKNGLYLVRWRVIRIDGSSDTVVKPVALIK